MTFTKDGALRQLDYFKNAIQSLPDGAEIISMTSCAKGYSHILLHGGGSVPLAVTVSTYPGGATIATASSYGIDIKWFPDRVEDVL